MIQRCYNPIYKGYENYGARGINVCDEWRYGFIKFYTWAINNGWAKGLTLDRIDNNKGYSPNNCRYVTYTTNLRNRRSNFLITKDGETKCVQAWADILGLTAPALKARIKRGLPVEKVLYNGKYKQTGRRKKIIS
jgi:hypothetical protein